MALKIYMYGDSLTMGLQNRASDILTTSRKREFTWDGVAGRPITSAVFPSSFLEYDIIVMWLGTRDLVLGTDHITLSSSLKSFLEGTSAQEFLKKGRKIIIVGLFRFDPYTDDQISTFNDGLINHVHTYDNVAFCRIADSKEVRKYSNSTNPVWSNDAPYRDVAERISNAIKQQSGLSGQQGVPRADDDTPKGDDDSDKPTEPKPSFEAVKKLISPENLGKNVEFNPPLPKKEMLGLHKYPNHRGFIVRDPVFELTFRPKNQKQLKKMSKAVMHYETPYGFRFLYNPDSYAEDFTAPTGGNPLAIIEGIAMGVLPSVGAMDSAQSAGVTFSLMLSRYEDMTILKQNNWRDKYPGGINEQQREDILNRGTYADLEYLFRLTNGSPQETWTGQTSDWGMLLPFVSILSLGTSQGSRRVRGFIQNIAYNHEFCLPGMIPVYTEVQISWFRMPDNYWNFAAQQYLKDQRKGKEWPTLDTPVSPPKSASSDMDSTLAKGSRQAVVDTALSWRGHFTQGTTKFEDNEPKYPHPMSDFAMTWMVFDKTYTNSLGKTFSQTRIGRSGKAIKRKELSAGDLVFYGVYPYTAVAIYMGNDTVFHFDDRKKSAVVPIAKPGERGALPTHFRRIMDSA